MYILIVDDNREIGKHLSTTFSPEDKVDFYDNYEDAKKRIEYITYDVICLDIFLSETKTGIDLCREIREKNKDAIIIMFSGENLSPELAAEMLEAGADSFVEKSSASPLLVHKAIKLIEKRKEEEKKHYVKEFSHKIYKKIELLPEQRVIKIEGKDVHVGGLHLGIFQILYEHPNKYIHVSSIIREVKNANASTGISIKAHIANLRKVLGTYANHIKNEWGGWYMFSTEE